MFSCALLSCVLVFTQTARDRAATQQELRGHTGSDDVTWIQASAKKAPVHIRGPFWSRGLSVHRQEAKSVWIVPGPSALGSTVGIGMAVDF